MKGIIKKISKLPNWLLLSLTLPLLALSLSDKGGYILSKIEIPKVWTDEAMKTWELPNPKPEYSPQPVSEEYYYAMAERTIYRSYPVYHPDHEPEGYWEWLQSLEPEVVWDPSKFITEEDWIKAGEMLFDHPIDTLGAILTNNLVRNPDFYDYVEMPLTPEGIMPFSRWVVTGKGRVRVGNLSCGMCHTRVMPDGSLIKGAQGNWAGDKASVFFATKEGFEPDNDLIRSMGFLMNALFGSPWSEGDPHGKLVSQGFDAIVKAFQSVPVGTFGRQGTSILFAPQAPDLIGVKDRKYLDHGGLGQHRGIEDMMRYIAMNQTLDVLNFYGDFSPLGIPRERLIPDRPIMFAGTHDRYSDEQLYALSKYVYSLTPPENPNKPSALSEKGKIIFAEQGCVTCHTPPLFTNNKLTPAEGFEIPEEHYEKYDIFDVSVGTDPNYTFNTRRSTGYYKIPSLKGLWYRGPYLHDGSISQLEDFFNHERLQEGWLPKPIKGHEFGMYLTEGDRKALVAYLLTL